MFLLLPRFCVYFSLPNLKKDDKYLAPPEIFFALLPGNVELATALRSMTKIFWPKRKFSQSLGSQRLMKFC